MDQGGHAPNIYLGWDIHFNAPMFEDFNLETACFSSQLIANTWIFSARNLRMSCSVLFSEQPLSELTSSKSSTVHGTYSYKRIGWVNKSPAAGPLQSLYLNNECVWSTLGQVNWETVCGRCYAAVSQFLEMVWHDPSTSVVYALVVIGNNLAKVT